METLENLQRKINSANDLESVVKTMKTMAASKIHQFEMASLALKDYFKTIQLGLLAFLKNAPKDIEIQAFNPKNNQRRVIALVFGSDQGLVGQFNNVLASFVKENFKEQQQKVDIWVVGERMVDRLQDVDMQTSKHFSIPSSVNAITEVVAQILFHLEQEKTAQGFSEFYIFHNKPNTSVGYTCWSQRLLPLDNQWKKDIEKQQWPTNKIPQAIGQLEIILMSLIKEYLFVSLYKSCSESLASENASRLEAMQRAEKNIEEIMDELKSNYHRLRQGKIDEELFDVVAGFESINKK